MLNSLLLIASFFTLIYFITSILNIVPLASIYENTLLYYFFACLVSLYFLRKNKENYLLAVNIIVISTLIMLYMALFVVLNDEFRLIWFFLVVFISFVLIGKRYGMIIMLFILISIVLINQLFDLGFLTLAQFTFFNSFLMFTAFSYLFLKKIEKDALEFESLNNKLENKVIEEVQQRKDQEDMLLRQIWEKC